jgi:hypothetical protein
MVRFNKKESAERRELLASLNQIDDAKENENGKREILCKINPRNSSNR